MIWPQAWLLIEQGSQHFDRGDYSLAISCYEQAAGEAHAVGDTPNELFAMGGIAAAWFNLDEYTKAVEAATRQLAGARQANDQKYEMQAVRRLAVALAELDLRRRWREIRPLLLDGLAIARRLGDQDEEIEHLRRLGEYAVNVGDLEPGLAWLQEALTATTPDLQRAHFYRCCVYSDLSNLMRKRGNVTEALRYAEMGVGEARLARDPMSGASAQLDLVAAERERGERLEALRLAEEVLADARQHGWKHHERYGEWLRAELERELGHPDVAEQAARRALELARELQLKEEEVEDLLSLGQALVALGRKDEAREALQQARRLSQERDYDDHFEKADELLGGVA